MGYRSEVRSMIYGPKDLLDAFIIDQQLISGNIVFKAFKDLIHKRSLEMTSEDVLWVLDLYLSSCKWYDEYDEVKAWLKLLDDAEEYGLEYEFIRVGEDDGDIEQASSENSPHFLYTSHPQILFDHVFGPEAPIVI